MAIAVVPVWAMAGAISVLGGQTTISTLGVGWRLAIMFKCSSCVSVPFIFQLPAAILRRMMELLK
jgi:hypothetical protein